MHHIRTFKACFNAFELYFRVQSEDLLSFSHVILLAFVEGRSGGNALSQSRIIHSYTVSCDSEAGDISSSKISPWKHCYLYVRIYSGIHILIFSCNEGIMPRDCFTSRFRFLLYLYFWNYEIAVEYVESMKHFEITVLKHQIWFLHSSQYHKICFIHSSQYLLQM
jgi:hypothetical protein